MVFMNGQINAVIKVNGNKIVCMAKENLHE